MKTQIHRRIGYFSLLLIIVLTFVSCHRKKEDFSRAVFHGYEKDDVKTWDPANAYDSVSLDLVPLIYETLYQYSYLSNQYEVEPLLAAQMPIFSKDRRTITIPIKRGVYFQDDPCFRATRGKGRELKAQDFVYGIKRLALPSLQSQGWWILDGKIQGINAFHENLLKAKKSEFSQVFDSKVEGIQALDDYTLQIKTTQAYPSLIYVLTMNFTSPVAREAVEAYGDAQGNVMDHPLGTGPFRLTHWERNRRIILERSPTFRGESFPVAKSSQFFRSGEFQDTGKRLPFLDQISMEVIKEDQPRWLNFLRGNLDSIVIPKDNFRQAIDSSGDLIADLKSRNIRLNVESGTTVRYILFNLKDPIIGRNKYLRQALSSAIHRDQWIETFTNGTGKKMVNAIPPGITNRPNRSKIKYDFDLKLAQELLAKAGYAHGIGLPIIRFDLRGASTSDRQFGDFIAQQWSQLGVQTEVVANTFPAFLEKAKQGTLQVASGGWALDYPDAENIYQLFFGPNESPGPNESNFHSQLYDQYYQKISSLTYGSSRASWIEKMEEILQEECPLAMGYYEAQYDLYHPWVKNFRSNSMILNRMKYYRIDLDQKKKHFLER